MSIQISVKVPSSLLALLALKTLNYKKHNTLKFLIGVTPQGTVVFIAKGWGGRVPDAHLMKNCGLLKKLISDDMILTERTIKDSAGLYCAEV